MITLRATAYSFSDTSINTLWVKKSLSVDYRVTVQIMDEEW